MIHGSRRCGAIRFEVESIATMAHCARSMCRKTRGAAFATFHMYVGSRAPSRMPDDAPPESVEWPLDGPM